MRDKKLYLSAKMQIVKCIQLWTIAQKGNKVSLHFIELIHLRLYSQKRTLWPLLNLIWKLYGTYFRCNICRHIWCDPYLVFVHISIVKNLDIYQTHTTSQFIFIWKSIKYPKLYPFCEYFIHHVFIQIVYEHYDVELYRLKEYTWW